MSGTDNGRANGRATGADVLLSLDGVTARYGEAVALRDISFHLPPGGALAVLGANGAGKTTLARVIAGVKPVSAGTVTFDGRDITRVPAHQRLRDDLAYLPENRGIFPSLSVAENLAMGTRLLPGKSRKAALETAWQAFPVLKERRSQVARTLSGGEQQMLALARVIAHETDLKLLIADEPSWGLAPAAVDVVYEAITRLREAGVSLILIEQFVDRALQLADTALLLKTGSTHWFGPAGEAKDHVAGAYGLSDPVEAATNA